MTAPVRGLTFGSVAERYERYRPGYPAEVLDLLVGNGSVSSAIEIGAGTGKATRLVAGSGISVTAVEPDPQMCAVLTRTTAGLPVTVVTSRLEELGEQPPAHSRPVDARIESGQPQLVDPPRRVEKT